MKYDEKIVGRVCETLVSSGSTFSPDKIRAYEKAILNETNDQAKWAMKAILENALVARKNRSPLCDDTGIPHLILEVGPDMVLTGNMMESI